jgi:hypothetical protein
MWREPIIISIQKGNVLSSCGHYAPRNHDVTVKVPFGEQQTDLFGMGLLKRQDDLTGAICGTVFTDEDLTLEVRLLHPDAVQSLPDELLVIISHD